MQQILAAQEQDVPNLALDIETGIYSGQDNQCAVQVQSHVRTDCVAASYVTQKNIRAVNHRQLNY